MTVTRTLLTAAQRFSMRKEGAFSMEGVLGYNTKNLTTGHSVANSLKQQSMGRHVATR
jgi:hypothetical protein